MQAENSQLSRDPVEKLLRAFAGKSVKTTNLREREKWLEKNQVIFLPGSAFLTPAQGSFCIKSFVDICIIEYLSLYSTGPC
jgi:hypothetical protein